MTASQPFVLHGTLRRLGTYWCVETAEGRRIVDVLHESNPSRLVGRSRTWVLRYTKRGTEAALDRRNDQERQADLKKGKVRNPEPERTIRPLQGGAPGLGRNRRGE